MKTHKFFMIFLVVLICILGLMLPTRPTYASTPADNASGCPLTAVNGNNNCFTVTPPLPGGAITINGVEGGGEWTGAQVKTMSGDFGSTLKLLLDANNLYLLMTISDSTYNASDQVRIFLDPLHNHTATADDIEFQIKRDTGGNPNHRKIIGGTDSKWTPSAGSAVSTASGAGSWTVEVKLNVTELVLSDMPSIIGFGVQAEDNPNNNLSTWPSSFNPETPAQWANLKTRYPVDFMIVLDQSGSMLSSSGTSGGASKWKDAKTAANFLANTLAIFSDSTYFEDHVGVVTFAWQCSGNNTTTTVKPLAQLSPFPVGSYTEAQPALADPVGNNCTPIGEGIKEAFKAGNLDANTSTTVKERQRVVLLLSDGLQNKPTNSLLPAGTGYTPCGTANWNPCSSSNVQVNTVALGKDSDVDTALMQNITQYYHGTSYNITTSIEELKEMFISSLDTLYRLNMAQSGGLSDFVVDAGNQKLVTILSWTDPTKAQDMILQRDTGGGNWQTQTCDQVAKENSAVGFSICVIRSPAAGSWRARAAGGANFNPNPTSKFVLIDLKLNARFEVDEVIHGTGNDIFLTADLRDAGLPLTNDVITHPVTVTVQIVKPTEGFGDLLSTRDPKECQVIEPQLPKFDPSQILYLARAGGGVASNGLALSSLAASTSVAGDPQSYPFALMQQLLRICNKDGLNRASEPTLSLYDDGTHGDQTANDGLYSLRFQNTQYEGSYVFRFMAEGKALDGSDFTRTRLTAAYVRLEVDPGKTVFDSQIYPQAGNIVIQQYYVLPRDRFGRYLGPGHADEIQFLHLGGNALTPVLDYGNGYYAYWLSYDKSQGVPVVTPVIQDKPIVPFTFNPLVSIPWWLWLLIIFLLIMIIIFLILLLLLCWRRQRK